MKLAIIIAAALLAGCASVKPVGKCDIRTGKGEVHQGVMGIGVGQALQELDEICARIKAKTPT